MTALDRCRSTRAYPRCGARAGPHQANGRRAVDKPRTSGSAWHRKALAVKFPLGSRRAFGVCAQIAIVLTIAQRRVANSRDLVGQRTGRLVVIAATLHRQRPLAKPETLLPWCCAMLAARSTLLGAMRQQHAQVAIPAFADAAQMTTVTGGELARVNPNQLAKCLASLKWLTLPDVAATIAVAVSSPTPGMLINCTRAADCRAGADSSRSIPARGTRTGESPPPASACSGGSSPGLVTSARPAGAMICSTPGVTHLTPPARTPDTARAAVDATCDDSSRASGCGAGPAPRSTDSHRHRVHKPPRRAASSSAASATVCCRRT